MSLATRLSAFATRIATESKALRTLINGNLADLSTLSTTAKGSLVAAINEIAASAGASINDAVTALGSTWSSTKINTTINAAVAALVGSAPGTLDTLAELAAAIEADQAGATAVTTALGNRVRTDINNQGLTGGQKQNARTNIDVYSTTEIGDPDQDLVAVFAAGLA